jgi:hypothetical protein
VFGRAVAGVVTALALLAASVAWAGWVYLHTVADPTRSNRIAHAILDNPTARRELAGDIAGSIATAADKALAAKHVPATVDGADPSLQGAVYAALSDPRIAANIVDAITAEHAEVLGATPPHPAVINTAALLAAVRAHLAPTDPQLARSLPAIAPAQVRLPAVKIPYARQARRWAQRWVHVLALGAVGGLLLALLIGDRAGVLRRAGFWAVGAGVSWAVLPPLAVWAGDTWAKSQAAVIRAVVRGATGGVTTAAVALAVGGVAAAVFSYVLPRLGGAPRHAVGRRPAGPLPPAPFPSSRPYGATPPYPAPAVANEAPVGAARAGSTARWGTDTWAPSGPPAPDAPVVYDRTGRLSSRAPVGPAPGPAAAPSAPQAAEASADDGAPAPQPEPSEPSPPPAGVGRPARRPGVSPRLLTRAGDEPGSTP